MTSAKLLVIGLDSAAPALVFDRWRDELPTLGALIARGAHGRLRSSNPPITVPAWTAMMASRDPGELGFYGFRNRKDHSYDGYQFANSALVRAPRLWDLLGEAGMHCVVLGVPQTYPPSPIRGEMVSCFLTPSTQSAYTYPVELKAEVEAVTGGYVLDVEDFRTPDKEGLLRRVYEKTDKHLALAKHLLRSRPWDFFMLVEMGVDRIHHGFWSYMDPAHHKYEAGNPFESAILDYYRHVDRALGELLSLCPPETLVLVVSDHGAKKMDGGICFNEWLMREGFLTLAARPTKPTPIGRVPIDWGRTRAWGDGGYYGRLFMNVRGREPSGTIDPGDYERVRDDLIAGIEAICDPQGRNIGSKAYRPEDVYRRVTGVAPDLIVYFGDLDWRSVGAVGTGGIHTFENDTGPDEANHDWYGIFVLSTAGAAAPVTGRLADVSIYDVAPTLLKLLGRPVPEGLAGTALW
ncbi:MAG TPA: alkaline phosphatase family protein [Candidatus Binatia bacterium]|nr:alkaline phosphatase family protein [Candidatus Binatia bacterium]